MQEEKLNTEYLLLILAIEQQAKKKSWQCVKLSLLFLAIV